MSSAQVQITQLPPAGSITGTELVPIVQNGQTVRTTTGAISASPSQTQTFLTLNQESTLPNSRYFAVGSGLTLTDGGAQSFYRISYSGIYASLGTVSTGILVNTNGTTIAARSVAASGAGLQVTNGDGIAGNPTVSLTGTVGSLAGNSGTGFLALPGNGTVSGRTLTGTANQIDIADPNGISDNPVFSISDDAILPGTGGVTVPNGTTAERPSLPNGGQIRYNTTSGRIEGYATGWQTLGSGDGTVTSVTGVANQIVVSNGTTTPQVGLASNPVLPGVSSAKLPAGGTADRPILSSDGMIRYNTDIGLFEGYINGVWTTFSSGATGVVSVATGTGLTGGPITSTGTISIANTAVTAGSYGAASKTLSATVNAQGQLTALSEANIAIANTQVSGLGTMSTQNANGVAITGGSIAGATINNAVIGGTTPDSGTFTSVATTTGTITTAPASGNDIVNKSYVDTLFASGVHFHQPVRVESPINLNATYNNGTAGVGATLTNAGTQVALVIDGVTLSVNDRVLIYQQTTQTQNGIYVVTSVGSGSTNWVLTRASDADTYIINSANGLSEGSTVFVQQGTTGAGETYTCNTSGVITFGTTNITFAQISSSQIYSAGTGLTLSGTQFSITNTAVTSGSYGSASSVATFSVNAQGQLTAAANATIAIANTQVSGLGTMSTQNANSVAITGGAINGATVGATTADTVRGTTITATTQFDGPGTGLTGTAAGLSIGGNAATATSATSATTATNATNVATTATSTNADFFSPFVAASTTGNQALGVDAGITYNPFTNALTASINGGTF
jgi:hypothetical protein